MRASSGDSSIWYSMLFTFDSRRFNFLAFFVNSLSRARADTRRASWFRLISRYSFKGKRFFCPFLGGMSLHSVATFLNPHSVDKGRVARSVNLEMPESLVMVVVKKFRYQGNETKIKNSESEKSLPMNAWFHSFVSSFWPSCHFEA